MNIELLATIIQGEGGICGPAGMMAVAMSLSCRIWQHGHSAERIAKEWHGGAEPKDDGVAVLLAKLVIVRELPDNPYYYCMGGRPDVGPNDWPEGDVIVRVGKDSIHLYRELPE